MGARPTGLGQAEGPSFAPDTKGNDDGKKAEQVTFRALVDMLLSDWKKGAATEIESSAEEKAKSLYDGPLVEVTYEPKPKQEKKGGKAQKPDASGEQGDEQQG
jgi:hypothetical protein